MMQKVKIKDIISISHEWMTYAFFFSLSLPDNILPLFVGLWAFSWVIWSVSQPLAVFSLKGKAKSVPYLFGAFVLLHFLSALWGEHLSVAHRYFESQLSFLLIVFFLSFGINTKISISKVVIAYFLGALVSILFFFVKFSHAFLTDGILKYQLDVLGMANYIDYFKHPAYWCLNIISSFFLFFYTFYRTAVKKWVFYCLYFALGIFIYWTGSRSGIISYIFILGGFAILYNIWKKVGTKKAIILSGVLLIAFTGLVLTNPKFQSLFDVSEHSSVNAPRRVLWESSFDLISEQPLLGYGIVTAKQELIQKSKENGIYNADVKNYNCHNQYLEIAIESGLISLLLFLAFFIFIYREQKSKYRSLVLMLILAFAFVFESMLLRIAGVTTFTAIVLFLFLDARRSENKELEFKERFWKITTIIVAIIVLLFGWMMKISSNLSFDSALPQTYASKVYKLVPGNELPLKLPITLPYSDACKFDSTAQASLWSGNAYMLNKVESKVLKKSEILKFSTYCYVSNDFDGAWVKASIDRDGGANFGSSFYDLSKKGTWQKLEVTVEGQTGEMPAYHYFCKEDANSFKELKGYVLFAYPQYIISEK